MSEQSTIYSARALLHGVAMLRTDTWRVRFPLRFDLLLVFAGGVAAHGCNAHASAAPAGPDAPVPTKETCGLPPHANVCLGRMDVPSKFEVKFRQGARSSIAAVLSEALEPALTEFIQQHAADPKIAASWKDHDAPAIVTAEREHYTKSINITTNRGLGALWVRIFSHNIAYEGVPSTDGTRHVPVNRYAMRFETAGDVANTIAHEVAHAAGLTHPDSDGNLSRAFCEPPYVIGTLVQKIAEGDAWRWKSSGDCACFAPDAKQEACVP